MRGAAALPFVVESAGHGTQEPSPRVALYLSTGHASHTLPSPVYPREQMQDVDDTDPVAPTVVACAAHCVQSAVPVAVLYVSCGHGVHIASASAS